MQKLKYWLFNIHRKIFFMRWKKKVIRINRWKKKYIMKTIGCKFEIANLTLASHFFHLIFFNLLSICIIYKIFLKTIIKYNLIKDKLYLYNNVKNLKEKYIEKGYKYKNLGIYLKNLTNNNNDLYLQNLKNLYKSYCYLLIRLNRKNLFLTLLNNEGNVLCKTNVGASGFKKKVKRTGYAIKGTGKKFIKKIKKSLIKNVFILYKKFLKNTENNNNLRKKIQNLGIYIKKQKKINLIKHSFSSFAKIGDSNKKIRKEEESIKTNTKKIIRSELLWIKIYKNLKKYRIYHYPKLSNLIKENLRIIFRIKTSLKLWAFRFIVYGLFKKLPWFRGIEFRLPIPHSNSLRLKKKRRV